MAGFTPDEGEAVIANLVYNQSEPDRGASLELALITNVAPGEAITEAALTEPSGGGYARKPLADANWAGSADIRSFAVQQFSPVGADYVGSIQGYAILTTGTTPRVLHVEVDSNGPYTLVDGSTYDITLNNAVQ